MRTTINSVIERLNVTQTQVHMAIYSGALPNPDEYEEWDSDYIEFFLKNWERRIHARRKQHLSCVNKEQTK